MPTWLTAIIAFLAGLVELALRLTPSEGEKVGEAKNEMAHIKQDQAIQTKVDAVIPTDSDKLDSDLSNGVF